MMGTAGGAGCFSLDILYAIATAKVGMACLQALAYGSRLHVCLVRFAGLHLVSDSAGSHDHYVLRAPPFLLAPPSDMTN